jgi:putative copper export protein
METDAWTLIRFLHVLGLAFFVGGQMLLVVAVVPVLRGREEATMLSVARRFGIASVVALTVVIATGIAMASHFSRWGDDTLNAKLAVLVLVGVLTGLHIATPDSRALSMAVFGSSLLVVWFGVVLAH